MALAPKLRKMENSSAHKHPHSRWNLKTILGIALSIVTLFSILIGGYVLAHKQQAKHWDESAEKSAEKIDKLTVAVAAFPDKSELVTKDRADSLVQQISMEVGKIVRTNEVKMAAAFDSKFEAFAEDTDKKLDQIARVQNANFTEISTTINKIEETLSSHQETLSDVSDMEKKMTSLEDRLNNIFQTNKKPEIQLVTLPPQYPVPGTTYINHQSPNLSQQPASPPQESAHDEGDINWSHLQLPRKKKGLLQILKRR